MARSSTDSAAAASKKSKATPAVTKPTSNTKAKKAVKKDSDPVLAPTPLDASDDDLERAEPFRDTLTSKRDRMVRKIQCTIPDGTSAVLQKEEKKKFTQTIKLSSKKPFSLEPVLMTYGPYAGLHVLVLQPEPDEHEKFPFLDLPAEIRNMIYSLVLERPGYHICLSGKNSGTIQTFWYNPEGRSSLRDQPYSTSLMRVNKQISVESTPYLFTRHTFEFVDSTMMQRFLEYLGPERTKSLVSVVVKQQYAVSIRQAYNLLSPATSLTKLELRSSHWYPYGYHIEFDWPSVLLPVFQSLCSAGRSRDDVFDMITIQGAIRGSCPEHGLFRFDLDKDCKNAMRAYEKFGKNLRSDLNKALDKAEAKKEAIKRGSPVKTRAGRKTKAVDYSGMED